MENFLLYLTPEWIQREFVTELLDGDEWKNHIRIRRFSYLCDQHYDKNSKSLCTEL